MSDDIKNNVKEDSKIKENTVIENTEEKINYIKKKEAEENEKANKLCILSVLLNFVPFFLFSIFEFGAFYELVDSNEAVIEKIFLLIFRLASLCPLISFLIMVYVRATYPKNTFGKILMALYIIGIIVLIIAFCVSIISCANFAIVFP